MFHLGDFGQTSAMVESPPAFSVSACLDKVREGDDDAARALVDHVYPQLVKIIRGRLPRRESEEDLLQDILLKMFANLHRFSGVVPFEHWLSRIAVNHCLNALRSEKSRPELRWADLTEEQATVLDALLYQNSPTDEPGNAAATNELVDYLLSILEPKDQLIIRMLELEDRSVEEVQSLTGWTSTMIRVRAFRARRKLNQKFKRMRSQGKL
jgi:RNA polymerase sigma factor (sigma-70 family)